MQEMKSSENFEHSKRVSKEAVVDIEVCEADTGADTGADTEADTEVDVAVVVVFACPAADYQFEQRQTASLPFHSRCFPSFAC